MTVIRRELPRSKLARSGRSRERIGHVEGSPYRGPARSRPPRVDPFHTRRLLNCPAFHPPALVTLVAVSTLLGNGPGKAQQLPCHGHDDLLPHLAAADQPTIPSVQAILRLPGNGFNPLRLLRLALSQRPQIPGACR